jgi:hypothetical protein
MAKRNKTIFTTAFALAIATTSIGMLHQSYPPSARFYLAMPGVLFGLLLGFAIDSQMLVIPAVVLANAFT